MLMESKKGGSGHLRSPIGSAAFKPFWLIADASWRLCVEGRNGPLPGLAINHASLYHPIGLTFVEVVRGVRCTPLAHGIMAGANMCLGVLEDQFSALARQSRFEWRSVASLAHEVRASHR
jgi:hypothetical protein